MGVTGLAASRRRRERGVELKTRLDCCIALTFLYIRSEPPGWIRARVGMDWFKGLQVSQPSFVPDTVAVRFSFL